MFLKTTIDDNIPRYVCDKCFKCNSKIGTSLNQIKNRGCCYYLP